MKWKDHRRISYYVCKSLGLSEDVARRVADASILPDKDPDYVLVSGMKRTYYKRVAHHSIEGVKMGLKYLKEARNKFVKGLSFEEPLGRALHYFQDYAVSNRSGWFIFSWKSYDKHDERENTVSYMNINPERVRMGLQHVVYPSQFQDVVYANGQKKEGREIMDAATYLTTLAVKLAVSPDVPEGIEEKYSKKLRTHIALVFTGFLGVLLVSVELGGGLVLGAVGGLMGAQ